MVRVGVGVGSCSVDVGVGVVASTSSSDVAVNSACTFRYSTMTRNSLLPLYVSTSSPLRDRIICGYPVTLVSLQLRPGRCQQGEGGRAVDTPVDGAVYLGEACAWVALSLETVNDIVSGGLKVTTVAKNVR